MGKSKAYQWFLEAKIAPKEQRVFVRKQMSELKKRYEFWDYLNLVWRKYQRMRCYYCGESIPGKPTDFFLGLCTRSWEIDHKLAIYYGGTNAPSNLCLACKPCNREKSTHLLERTWVPGHRGKDMAKKKPNKLFF